MTELSGREEKRPATKQQKIGYALAGVSAFLLITLACFYIYLTVRLLPIAFPQPTQTAAPTFTQTPTLAPSPTSTATPLPTFTVTPPPTQTTMPAPQGFAKDIVWVRAEPNLSSEQIGWLPVNGRVTILATYGEWLKISWTDASGEHIGWVMSIWVSTAQPLPSEINTPFP